MHEMTIPVTIGIIKRCNQLFFWNTTFGSVEIENVPRKEIATRLELGTHFLDSLLNHGMMECIKICRFKTFLEQRFDKEPSCRFLLTTTC